MDYTQNVLMIADSRAKDIKDLARFVSESGNYLEIYPEISDALERIQDKRYQVIILDADIKCIKIDGAIRIIKNIDPRVKIIVRTSCNSKQLEIKVRREKIYYYHLNSFGIDELKIALESALESAEPCAYLGARI